MTKKILVVDDSMFVRTILKNILDEEQKYEILETGSGSDAKKLYEKEKPDLTLLDIVMLGSKEQGIDVLKFIMEINPGAKAVMITAMGNDSLLDECKNAGAVDCIIKPFNREQVIAVGKKYLD